jgi:hypothetical protein
LGIEGIRTGGHGREGGGVEEGNVGVGIVCFGDDDISYTDVQMVGAHAAHVVSVDGFDETACIVAAKDIASIDGTSGSVEALANVQ